MKSLPPALILAGGKSSRMGEEKTLLTIGSDTILRHIVRRLMPQVSSVYLNAPTTFTELPKLPRVPDTLNGQIGPLAGVLAGLRHAKGSHPDQTHLLTVPSDSPFLPTDLVSQLSAAVRENNDVIIASSGGRDHPVFGLWPVSLADDLEAWLAEPDNRRIHAFLRRHPTVTVDFPFKETPQGLLDPFLNINTPDDLELARRFADELT
ncbi:molybdenum cofactor guanylyltransferase MobA [Neorhizobium turbinariae]|nr:molybdenum cofactor guanylyltransferase MobA [Neorhizobium turbinariae]